MITSEQDLRHLEPVDDLRARVMRVVQQARLEGIRTCGLVRAERPGQQPRQRGDIGFAVIQQDTPF